MRPSINSAHPKFKTYFVLSTNCVLLADSMQEKLGLTIRSPKGFIIVGTYQDYLDLEYTKPNGLVVSRSIYQKRKLQFLSSLRREARVLKNSHFLLEGGWFLYRLGLKQGPYRRVKKRIERMIEIKINASRKVMARKMEGDGPLIVEQLKLKFFF